MAQAENNEMLKREPYIDLVIGPQAYHKINDKIEEYLNKQRKLEETAFKYNGKGGAADQAYRENIIDWYKTVGREARKSDELASINQKILNTTDIKQKEGLVREFKRLGNVEDVSAYLVTNTIPTYSKVPEIIRAIRKLPIGNFIAFPAEILRTSAHLLNIGARELTSSNPFIRQKVLIKTRKVTILFVVIMFMFT